MDTPPTTPDAPTDAEKPKQYIRTFHGDLETVKKGGTPNLAPLAAQAPAVRPAAPSPAPSAPAPAPAPAPIPAPAPPPIAPPSPGVYLPTTEIPPITIPTAPSSAGISGTAEKTAPLETYAGDFSERMKQTQASAATVLAAEQDKAPRLVQVQPEKPARGGALYITVGSILLIAGMVGAYFAYTKYLSGSEPILLLPTVAAPIFVDEREQISGTAAALMQAIQQSATRPLAQGSIRLLYLGSATSTDANVFSALQLPAPGALLRNINGARSMAGIAEVGGTRNPFFILSVTSFGDTFAALLQWEQKMPRDLAKLFPAYPAPASAPQATTTASVVAATSTSPTSATTTSPTAPPLPVTPPSTAGFFDEVIANHDVRVYRDTAGRDVLLYGYWDRTTLIIARDAAAFTEIIGRLATSRAQ